MRIKRRPLADRRWLDNDGRFLIGKHKGELAEEVAVEDPSYVNWVVEEVEDIDDTDRETLDACLSFRDRGRR